VIVLVPTKRFYQVAACAVAFAAAPAARAVIFQSTGDPTFHTTAPTTGTFANSGWQYQINFSDVSATAVGPNHIITAAHTGAGPNTSFVYNGVTYTTTEVTADFDDLRLLRVDKPIYSYAPLHNGAAAADPHVVLIGRGTQRGSEVRVSGTLKGWNWGAVDGVRRWGTNTIFNFANNNTLMRFNFDNNGDPNEAVLSDKDSGGGEFMKVGQQWTLAGVNYAVTGPYSIPPDSTEFLAALYDTSGMLDHQSGAGVPSAGPSGAYGSAIAPYVNNLKTLMDLPPTWKAETGGSWLTASNWDLPTGKTVPNAVGAIADFRTAIGAAQNVTFTGIVTVGQIDFDNPIASYSLVGGISASQLHLNVASGQARVNVASGNHSISALHLDDPTTFYVIQPTSTLTANISSAGGQAITKTGAGTLAVNRLISGAVNVSEGNLRVNSNGTSGATSKVPGVSVNTAAGAKLDLMNNDMIVTNTSPGDYAGGSYTGLIGLIARSYGFGEFTGPGITSSTAAGNQQLTTLAITRATDAFGISPGDTVVWSGQPVSGSDTLIAYTYAGDVNLDGIVDAADYGIIDNYFQFPGTTGYANGDFNFDGVIDAGDYGLIDNSFQLQSGALISSAPGGSAALSGVSAVPEPGAATLAAVATIALLARRRRRRADVAV